MYIIIICFLYKLVRKLLAEFFILADDLSLKPKEALDKSKQMMDGYKWKMFYLTLRFFGLGLLCLLTLGIGFLWLIPYSYVAMAKFYDDINQSEMNAAAAEIAEAQE